MLTIANPVAHNDDFAIKRFFLLPLLAMIILLPATLALFAFFNELEHKRQTLHAPIARLEGQFNRVRERVADILSLQLESIARIEALQQAFLSEDRQELLLKSQPLFLKLRAQFNISHFYFHLPNGVNHLRVHQPDTHGDRIERFTLRQAMTTGKTDAGIEVGPLGIMTLRVVAPWRVDGRLIGYLELGKDVSHILQHLESALNMKLILLTDKRLLQQTKWLAGMRMMHFDTNWERHAEVVAMAPSRDAWPIGLDDYLSTGFWKRSDPHATLWEGNSSQSHNFGFFSLAIIAPSNERIGWIIGIHEHDAFDTSVKTSLTIFFCATGLAMVVAFLLFRLLANVESQLQSRGEALRHSKETLSIAQSLTRFGSWDWDIASGTAYCSPDALRVFGLSGEEHTRPMDALLRMIPEKERERVAKALSRIVDHPETVFDMTHSLLRENDEQAIVHQLGKAFRGPHGKTVRMIGVVKDITRMKHEEQLLLNALQSRLAMSALAESGLHPMSLEQQLLVVLDTILSVSWLGFAFRGSFFLFDPDANELVCIARRNFPDELTTACHRVPLGHCLCGRAAASRSLLYSPGMDDRHEVQYPGMEEHGHYCLPIMAQERLLGVLNLYLGPGHRRNDEGDAFLVTVGYTIAGLIQRRETERKLTEAENALRQMAHYDAVTGLPNRVLFQELLEQNIALANRHEYRLAVLFVDLDHFKAVNDSFGHHAGDALLQAVASRMKRCVRSGDLVSRLGGDEFVILLHKLKTNAEAGEIAGRVVQLLQEPFSPMGHHCEIGSSIGIAIFPDHAQDITHLLKLADETMYAVKQQGRNHWRLYTPA
ncbi:MAG: diguanylate cyclase [Magnetococcales bacterium]|nr:diguanylate cyclase [Magnetococcales bacterium]